MDIKNLKSILSLIEKGNNLGEKITLVGATKTVDSSTIQLAVDNGLKVIAENKVQEFRLKHGTVKNATEHFIGHLQQNKVKYLVGNVELIHSVDSIPLAVEIDKFALKKGVVQEILLEINVGNELSKSGFSFDEVSNAIKEISLLKNVKVSGIMGMLPKETPEKNAITLCEKIRKVYDRLNESGYNLTHLSLGMSEDYRIAIEHGSNMIRLGTAIFGKRDYGENK